MGNVLYFFAVGKTDEDSFSFLVFPFLSFQVYVFHALVCLNPFWALCFWVCIHFFHDDGTPLGFCRIR